MAVSRYAFNEALSTLGLEIVAGELPDKKLIRQAYSRQAKIRRPDTDPQGFQEVRQAYETALEALADGIWDYGIHDEDEDNGDERHDDHVDDGNLSEESQAAPDWQNKPSPGAPVPAARLNPQDIPELPTPPARAELDLPVARRDVDQQEARGSGARPQAAPGWLETLEREKEDLAARRNALFELLTAQPQNAALLIQDTHKLLQLPALDQLDHRIEVYSWLKTLAAWHPAATPAWRTLIAVACGLDAESPEPAHDDTEARLIQRLREDRALDEFRRRSTVDPDSPEAVWTGGKTKGTRWWRLARRALDSNTREATDVAHDWLASQSPDDVHPQAEARWNNAKRLAPLGTHRTALLAVVFWMTVFGPLEKAVGGFAAALLGAVSAFGLTLMCLLAFGAGLGWLRAKLIAPVEFKWSALEIFLGALLLASAAMSGNGAGDTVEPVFWWALAVAVPVWILCGSIGFMVQASPLEWVGWAQFWGMFAIALFAASGAAHFTWPEGLAAIVLLLACHPDGAVKRYANWTFAVRGGDFFTLRPKTTLAWLSALHVVHALLCITLPQGTGWIQLALVSTGILLLYADVLLMGLPIGDGDGIGRFILFGIILMPVIVQAFKDAGPGYEKAFLDALCLIPIGLAYQRERKRAA